MSEQNQGSDSEQASRIIKLVNEHDADKVFEGTRGQELGPAELPDVHLGPVEPLQPMDPPVVDSPPPSSALDADGA